MFTNLARSPKPLGLIAPIARRMIAWRIGRCRFAYAPAPGTHATVGVQLIMSRASHGSDYFSWVAPVQGHPNRPVIFETLLIKPNPTCEISNTT